MSFSRYIPFEGCGGPERTESLWGGWLVYCLLLPAVVRSLADGRGYQGGHNSMG